MYDTFGPLGLLGLVMMPRRHSDDGDVTKNQSLLYHVNGKAK